MNYMDKLGTTALKSSTIPAHSYVDAFAGRGEFLARWLNVYIRL